MWSQEEEEGDGKGAHTVVYEKDRTFLRGIQSRLLRVLGCL